MNCSKCRKAYVSVNLDVDEEGAIQPRLIRWKDGLIFQIDQILYKCRATSKKVGGGGIRYTVMIRGKESFLFHEGDKWFVEAKENAHNSVFPNPQPSFVCASLVISKTAHIRSLTIRRRYGHEKEYPCY